MSGPAIRAVPGRLSGGHVAHVTSAPWFTSRSAPFALVDRDLRIRAVNQAFEAASGHGSERLVGRLAHEAFPDNPHDPASQHAAAMLASMHQVLRSGSPHWLEVSRYDVPHESGRFVPKVWMPVNRPVLERGRVVGVLNHSQDLTQALVSLPGPHAADGTAGPLSRAVDTLQRQFPGQAPEAVLGILTHSLRVLLEATGSIAVEKAVELARLRLEIQSCGPALPLGQPGDSPSA